MTDAASSSAEQLPTSIPYQVLVEQSLVGIYLIQDGILKYCNSVFAGITGHTPEQIIGRRIAEMVAPESLDEVQRNVEIRIKSGTGTSRRYFNRAIHVDGHLVDLEVHGQAILHEGKPAIAGVAVNVTKRLQYERETRESHFQLQQMTRYAIKLREKRRQEMAREIHDVLGGLLTSIKLDATRIINRQASVEVDEIAEDILVLAQESIDFVRSKSEELYPASLQIGLVPSVETLLRKYQQRSQIDCHLSAQPDLPKLAPDAELMVYRIIQESLTNIARHAEASRLKIDMQANDFELQVQIDDNGLGMPAIPKKDKSFGVRFMHERAADFGGRLALSSSPMGGVRVSLQVPLKTQGPQDDLPPPLEPGMRL
ncbi:MAG: PAS domain-containing sensor histidine kinase [Oceanobacter sp.]